MVGGSLRRVPADLHGAAFMPHACTPCGKPRGGDRDPREQEGPAGLAHRGEAKGLRLLLLKTSAGEARGREKLFKLPYNVDIKTTRYKLPVNKAGLGIAGFFTAGGGGLRNYPLAERWRVLSSAPGHDGCLHPPELCSFPPGLTSVGTRGAPNSPTPSLALSPAPGEQEMLVCGSFSLSPAPSLLNACCRNPFPALGSAEKR